MPRLKHGGNAMDDGGAESLAAPQTARKPGVVVETPRVLYGALMVFWTLCALLILALIAQDGRPGDTAVVLIPIIGLLFSATGLLRQKRIELSGEMLTYRPVWGRTRALRRRDIEAFDVFVLNSRGSGFLICKMRPGLSDGAGMWRRRNLGFLLMPNEALKPLRTWLGRRP